jgi:hypothetical protein
LFDLWFDRGERRLNICDIAEHPNPRNPFLYATVEEWTQQEEEGNERQSQEISDGFAEFSLVKEILTSLKQLAQCYQQRYVCSPYRIRITFTLLPAAKTYHKAKRNLV